MAKNITLAVIAVAVVTIVISSSNSGHTSQEYKMRPLWPHVVHSHGLALTKHQSVVRRALCRIVPTTWHTKGS